MMNRNRHILLIVALALLLPICPAFSQISDSERVIDVSSLTRAIQEATQRIGQRMEQSQLIDRFNELNDILTQDELDKPRLIVALKALDGEIEIFGTNFHESTDPLWKATEKIAETVDKVRMLLARGPGGKVSARAQQKLVAFDKRLTNLARSIKAETDPRRKARLKIVFSNVHSLRALTEQAGRLNLDPAREALFARMINVLVDLENQLTIAVFGVERARISLTSQADMIRQYTFLVQNLVDVEALAKGFGDLRQTSNPLGSIETDLQALTDSIDKFNFNMAEAMEGLVNSIEGETAKASWSSGPSTIADINVDDEIDRYAKGKTPSGNSPK